MSNSKPRKSRHDQNTLIASLVTFDPAKCSGTRDFGSQHVAHEKAHDDATLPMRDWFMSHVAPKLPRVQMTMPIYVDNVLQVNKDGTPKMATWLAFDLGSDELANERDAYYTGAYVTLAARTEYTRDGWTGAAVMATTSEDAKKLEGKKKDAYQRIRGQITNYAHVCWSRGPKRWLTEASDAAKRTAMGADAEDPRLAFPAWIQSESKKPAGGLREILRRRGSAEKDGIPVQSEALVRAAAALMAKGWQGLTPVQRGIIQTVPAPAAESNK